MRRRGSGAATALTALLAGVALTGCGVHADRRATGADICASALSVGQALAGPDAALVRVERLSGKGLQRVIAAAPAPGPTGGAPSPSSWPGAACALAYRGAFAASRLPAGTPLRGTTGPVLVLLTTTRSPQVFEVLVLPALPRDLAH